ncbi:hypothetical protein AF72_11560 [Xylella taiwanensis]|uniref:Uncharacterized protein n=1 Tax=Xylella taiwanensis TaxID=1444770 RepID=Z9JHT3_9GAMM|nr:hypothetical protein AF72_11560 [Xylella taiwanensis]
MKLCFKLTSKLALLEKNPDLSPEGWNMRHVHIEGFKPSID